MTNLKMQAAEGSALAFVDSRRFLMACLALGVFFRFYLAYNTSFWLDELWSSFWSDPAHSLRQVINYALADVHPPLYQILLHAWFNLFGFTEASGRSLSLVIGLLSLPAFWGLARAIYDEQIARMATMVFALSPSAAAFSAEVRNYELLMLFAIISTASLALAIRQSNVRWLVIYFVSALASVYTHYFGFILLLTHGVSWLVLSARGIGRKLFGPVALVYVVLLIGIIPLAKAMLGGIERQHFWIHNPGILELLEYIPIYFGGPFAAPIFLLAIVILLLARPRISIREGLLLLSVGLMLAVPWLMGFVMNPVITVRNTIIAVPYWCLLAGWIAIQSPRAWLKILYLGSFVIIAILGIVLTPVYKGEDIDRLLEAFQENPVPVYLVKTADLETDIFLRTKIRLNAEKYQGMDFEVAKKGEIINEPAFWLACYHTCNKVNIQDAVPEGYRIGRETTGKGIRGILVTKEARPE